MAIQEYEHDIILFCFDGYFTQNIIFLRRNGQFLLLEESLKLHLSPDVSLGSFTSSGDINMAVCEIYNVSAAG